MTYASGENPAVKEQPPHRATQYRLPASMSANREASAEVGRSLTTFGPSPSLMSSLSRRPCGQGGGSDFESLRKTFRSFRYGLSGITYSSPACLRCLTAHMRHQTSTSAAIRAARSSPALPLMGTMCGGISERQWQISAARSIISASFSVSSPKMASAIDQTAINPGSLSGGCNDNAGPSHAYAPPDATGISARNCGENKPFSPPPVGYSLIITEGCSPVVGNSAHRLPPVSRMGRTAGPAGLGCPPPLRTRRAVLQCRNRPLSGTALCCTIPVLPRQTPQRPRRDFVLSPGGRFAAVCAPFPLAATDLHTPSKARIDHVAHSSVLKSAGTRLAPLGVFQ